MITRKFKGAAVAVALALSLPTVATAAPRRHAAPVKYGKAIGTYQLRSKHPVQLGAFRSVAAAVRAARAAKLPPDGYAFATTPSRHNGGEVAIDAQGVVHALVHTMGSGPVQRPPSLPETSNN